MKRLRNSIEGILFIRLLLIALLSESLLPYSLLADFPEMKQEIALPVWELEIVEQ